jgi:hypothetical protein
MGTALHAALDRFDPYRVYMDIEEVTARVRSYMHRQMPPESVLVGKNRWKPQILVFMKSGYEQVKLRVPKQFNHVDIVITTVNQIGDNK